MNVSKISSKYVPISINPFYHLRGYLLKDIQVFSDIAFLPNLMLLNLLFWKFSTKCVVLKLTQLLIVLSIIIGMHSLGGGIVFYIEILTHLLTTKKKKKKNTGKPSGKKNTLGNEVWLFIHWKIFWQTHTHIFSKTKNKKNKIVITINFNNSNTIFCNLWCGCHYY